MVDEFARYREELLSETNRQIGKCFAMRKVWYQSNSSHDGGLDFLPVKDPESLFAILSRPDLLLSRKCLERIFHCRKLAGYYFDELRKKSPEVQALYEKYGKERLKSFVNSHISQSLKDGGFYDAIFRAFPTDRIIELLMMNPHYKDIVRPLVRRKKIIALLSSEFINSVPDNYAMLYPEARAIKRHFILHVGPTNSGKTYDAVQELAAAHTGVYLAPLRLLAYEQYEKLTALGVKCSMITGEERILTHGATHQSSTIEILDFAMRCDVAVIDEAQMAADEDRGGAWTSAILGVLSDRVHVCFSRDALGIVLKMVESCQDTYEIVEHERKTPLIPEKRSFRYPSDVKSGDALIVFSRKDVQACAADLMDHNIKCSVIYGNLPYDVRHAEAEKFASGKTKVVVSTDAIGMGMNLPIRRIVFLRVEKYDGRNKRELTGTEIKQIAGRAGRYGIYEKGFVSSYIGMKKLRQDLFAPDTPIEKAVINIPPIFYEKEGKISEILEAWDSLPATRDYNKANIETKIQLARELEEESENKALILEFVSIPFEPNVSAVHDLWRDLFECLNQGIPADLPYLFEVFNAENHGTEARDAESLELLYKIYDLLYVYASRHGTEEDILKIFSQKRIISDKLNIIFGKSRFQNKKCRVCGKKILWLSPYALCDGCFRNTRRSSFRAQELL